VFKGNCFSGCFTGKAVFYLRKVSVFSLTNKNDCVQLLVIFANELEDDYFQPKTNGLT